MKPINSEKNKDYIELIGGEGWAYFFSDAKPKRAINDWWLYYQRIPFTTKTLLNSHSELINQPSGYEFWIHKALLDGGERSKYFEQILAVARPVDDAEPYTKFKIK